MKRTVIIRHVEFHGSKFVREGGNHTIYHNPAKGTYTDKLIFLLHLALRLC
jgi:predicted RNA binding protein YcfA (HicA-like mRNA interferase family)